MRKESLLLPIIFCMTTLIATGAEPATLTAEVALTATLDEPRGYCLDVVGSQRRAMPERGLQAHTCYAYQGRIAVDQSFDVAQLRAGRWRLPAFEVCMRAAQPGTGARLQLTRCDESPAQDFSLMPDGRITTGANPELCVTVGAASGRPGGGGNPVHLMRALTLETCRAEDGERQRWVLRQPGPTPGQPGIALP